MEISTFWLYVVMKLDAISVMIGLPGFIIALLSGFVLLVMSMCCCDAKSEKPPKSAFILVAAIFLIGSFMACVGKLIPTTKEAAFLFIAPKVANSEFMQEDLPGEAKELYGLAKQYLKDQVEKEKK